MPVRQTVAAAPSAASRPASATSRRCCRAPPSRSARASAGRKVSERRDALARQPGGAPLASARQARSGWPRCGERGEQARGDQQRAPARCRRAPKPRRRAAAACAPQQPEQEQQAVAGAGRGGEEDDRGRGMQRRAQSRQHAIEPAEEAALGRRGRSARAGGSEMAGRGPARPRAAGTGWSAGSPARASGRSRRARPPAARPSELGIAEIAEMARAGRAGRARRPARGRLREALVVDAVDAERALLHHALLARRARARRRGRPRRTARSRCRCPRRPARCRPRRACRTRRSGRR